MTSPSEEPGEDVRAILLEAAELLDQIVRTLSESSQERGTELLEAQSRLQQLRARLANLRPTDR